MFELFILGKLLERPMHGYGLHQAISMAIGPTRQLGWGALYPLIRRLAKEGFIAFEEQDTTAPTGGHQRKTYRLTETGKQRFLELMLQPAEYDADYADRFNIKMGNFRHVPAEAQLEICRQYREYLLFLRTYLQSKVSRVTCTAELSDAQRPHILSVLQHRLHLVAADLQWLEAYQMKLTSGETPAGRPT